MDPTIVQYLEGIGFDKWTRANFSGNRYNIMTSNYAKSFNNKFRDARTFPVTTFVEFIHFTIQSWFPGHHHEVEKCTSKLSPLMEKYLEDIAADAKYLKFHILGQLEFHVVDPNGDGMFQIIGIPCDHAVAVAIDRGVNFYSLYSPFYTTKMLMGSYKETIYPTGNEDEWIVPKDIKNMEVGVPVEKPPIGRPKKRKVGRKKTKCCPSTGEVL
ncbi:uncharacterized protein LOC133832716 [Humulus lupulus]|uniref:uncharacterized protein LOC133832716 n=1 Tax=Humulus lupulus TaxID=3486 RepID=UPI002B408475|nr:uncharacterized protein LOC133832716 [Humulus lupulus]